MKLRLLSFLLLGFILTSSNIFAQNVRVLGYFPQYRETSGVQYSKLTDVAFSFINPNANGTLKTNGYSTDAMFGFNLTKFTIVKDGCANAGTNLWIALGGADKGHQRDARLNSVSGNSGYRTQLANDLVNFCITHGVYGIAVDWEFPNTPTEVANHVLLLEAFETAINASSNPNLKISVAVGGEYKGTVNHLSNIHTDLFNSKAHLVDEWHVMAYDFPASYNDNHSTYADAESSMDGWNGKGMPYNKMLLGVPFYGRDAGRNGEKEYNNLTGSAATNYSADASSGWLYNGKTTLESKIDLAVAKGSLGILIWDIGQDRPAGDYSLLDAIDAKALSVCPIAKPNLGPDKGVCAPNSITLDPGVVGSFTYTWTKDGGSSIGSGATLSVSDAGTYKVVISNGSCSREDEIIVVSGSPITTTGDAGCDDETLTLSINGADGAKTYDWYDANVSGTVVNTGTTYSDIFASTSTFYVEERAAGVNNYTSSPIQIPDAKFHSWAGGQYTFRCAQMLVVETDLTIKSLRILASKLSGITFNVKVIEAANAPNFVNETEVGPFTSPAESGAKDYEYNLFDFDVNISLSPGTYLIYIEPTTGNEENYGIVNAHTEESTEAGVYTLKGSTFQASAMDNGFPNFNVGDEGQSWWTAYGPFLNWKIETGANASCGRTPVTVSVISCGPPEVTIVSPTNAGQYYTQAPAIDFEATVTDGGTVSSVVFEVWKGLTKVATLPTNSSGSTYTATWTATDPGTDYEFKVIATDNDNNDTEAFMDFDVDFDVAVGDVIVDGNVGVYPNPATDNFNVSFDMTTANTVSIEVVNTIGAVVYTDALGTLNGGSQLVNINANLSEGLYFVNVKVGNEVVSTPLNVIK